MASSHQHTIQKQIVRLQVTDRDNAYHLQTEFLEVLKSKVLPGLEVEMDRLTREGQEIEIDKLELDLGKLPAHRLGEDLAALILEQFRDQMHRIMVGVQSGNEPAGVVVRSQEAQQLEHFERFLKTGTVSWQVEGRRYRPQEVLDTLLAEAPGALRELLGRMDQVRSLQRIGKQFRPEQVEAVILLLQPAWKDLLKFAKFQLVEKYGPLLRNFSNEGFYSAGIGKIVLAAALVSARPERAELLQEILLASPEPLVRDLLAALPGPLPRLRTLLAAVVLREAWVQARDTQLEQISLSELPLLLEGMQVLKSTSEAKEWQEWLKTAESLNPGQPQLKATVLAWIGEVLDSGLDMPAHPPVELARRWKKIGLEVPKKWAPSSKASVRKAGSETRPERKKRSEASEATERKRQSSLPEAVYLDNAGIVLLNPFIPHCFEGLGWCKEGRFVEEAAREKAVSMLWYLSHGPAAPEGEQELVLNKLLAGLDWDAPVDFGLNLTDAEMEEGDRLLTSAITYWEKLGKVNPDQFRKTFLQREGRLREEGGGWQLKVDRQSYDVLLEFLPWSFGIVKFPWMERLLTVDW